MQELTSLILDFIQSLDSDTGDGIVGAVVLIGIVGCAAAVAS